MKAKEFDIKKRDPNWRAMQDIRRSGAGGQHKDKKKAEKQGEIKHKGKDVEEGIGGMIAGGVGQFLGNKIDPLAGEIMRSHGEIAGRKAEYTIRKYMHLLQKALKQQLDSGEKDESVREDSDWGEPREILEDVLQTLEREVEWPLTEVMDPKEVRQLLAPIVRAVNDKMMSMEEGWDDQDDWGSMSHREFKRREMEHELGHENKPRENKGMWFYNVPTGKDLEARSIGLKQTKSGKWYSRKPSTVADMKFGQGRYWEPK